MKTSSSFMFYLAGLSMLGYLATDMYLPAFGAMQRELQTTAGAISASLSIFLAGFAIAQLIWGPFRQIGPQACPVSGFGVICHRLLRDVMG